jgi:hypothetical protein
MTARFSEGAVVRLIDVVFRGGHLSERALVDVCMTGERPAHLDRCDICAERATDLGRWLDGVRMTSDAAIDAAFPPEKLAVQQAQIMRKLEQLDQPSRVIAFPNYARSEERQFVRRGIAPSWAAAMTAAALIIGVVGGQITARLTMVTPLTTAGVIPAAVSAPEPAKPTVAETQTVERHDNELARASVEIGDPIDSMTPKMVSEERNPLVNAIPVSYRGNSGGR